MTPPTTGQPAQRPQNPQEAWDEMCRGNDRFVAVDTQRHLATKEARGALSTQQRPFAVVLGCSDSRVAAEHIFDQGLGNLFVIRTAGHVLDTTVIGSIEYGVVELGVPLIVVLGHDSCGAIGAARDAVFSGNMPEGFIRSIVDKVIPSLLTRSADDDGLASKTRTVTLPDDDELRREHVRTTVRLLRHTSPSLAALIDSGQCAVVGAEYTLAEGGIGVVSVDGDVAQPSSAT